MELLYSSRGAEDQNVVSVLMACIRLRAININSMVSSSYARVVELSLAAAKLIKEYT